MHCVKWHQLLVNKLNAYKTSIYNLTYSAIKAHNHI